ncbi:hypothetical protein Bca52824_073046 [Brassica carinata]|uniref:Uncharacterized protein n=1 Tax=Brassica carinata TaxID=52824 RepID=A0A8X7U4U7_BRACI|nr:hypothetical protein Bca52824_073046 [Brassica carinata]
MIFRGWDPGTDSESPIPVVCSQKVDVGKKGKRDRDLTRSSSEDLHGSGLDKGRKGSGRWRKSSILSNWIWIWILVTIKAISQIRREPALLGDGGDKGRTYRLSVLEPLLRVTRNRRALLVHLIGVKAHLRLGEIESCNYTRKVDKAEKLDGGEGGKRGESLVARTLGV